jgi:hypothetical protein
MVVNTSTPRGGIATAIGPTEHWCPQEAQGPIVNNRTAAQTLLGVPALKAAGLTGKGVNVVIVDYGLDADRLRQCGARSVDGWDVGNAKAGHWKLDNNQAHGGHGMLVAMNILAIAPDVSFFDLPMVPPNGIGNISEFFERTANAAFEGMLDKIKGETKPGPWVLVNAWAIYDRSTDRDGAYYTNNPAHPFNRLMDRAVAEGRDVVFGAGNCGEFCPSWRCGPGVHGPGNSIFGANSHPKVLTVGAVNPDKMWLGYSSQGPGQSNLAPNKPDLCAPTEFVENADAGIANTGTSASCALAAGVIACLRSGWDPASVPPEELKKILIRTTTNDGRGWNGMTGHGILNAKNAYDALAQQRSKRAAS